MGASGQGDARRTRNGAAAPPGSRAPSLGVAVTGGLLVVAAFLVYLVCNRQFNAGRGDFFYLADAFLHGRTWILHELGPFDNVVVDGRVYVPFGPFPAIALGPLVALVGPRTADSWQPIVNAALAALDFGLAWLLVGRLGVRSLVERGWLVVLFGFSTAIWWVTTRGGVWHTGHLIATLLTLVILLEFHGRRRAWLVGLLGGAAFLTRAPLLFALPFYGLWFLVDHRRRQGLRKRAAAVPRLVPVRAWIELAIGFLPGLLFSFWYNDVRFGSPLESGYALASLPPWLAALRDQGLFSVSHLVQNVDYLFLHPPSPVPTFPFLRPDGFGLSILLTSPGLLLAVRADWSSARSRLLLGAAVATLVPSLLYYGGGWLQYGFRYALDSIPFVFALAALAVARHGLGRVGRALIVFGFLVNLAGVYWAYNI
jgi:hypothetical protein